MCRVSRLIKGLPALMLHIVRPAAVVLMLACAVACGDDPPALPAPTPTPPTTQPPPPPPNQWSLSGRVVDTVTGAPVPQAVLQPAGFAQVTAGDDGVFSFEHVTLPQYSPYEVTVSAPGYITRAAQVMWQRGPRTGVEIGVIRDAPPFSLEFYREIVRNGMETPENLQPLRRWTAAPRIYIQTIDDVGRSVEPEVLELVREWTHHAVAQWTGWSVPTTELGTEARGDVPGWIRVVFVRTSDNICGTSYVGRNPGLITYSLDSCDCGSRKVAPGTIMHEVGHALGFWHVGDRQSMMFPYITGGCRPTELSALERHHATIAYRRLPGSTDIDRDGNQTGLGRPASVDTDILVVD